MDNYDTIAEQYDPAQLLQVAAKMSCWVFVLSKLLQEKFEVDTATLAYSIRTEDEEDITCSLKDDILLAQMVLGTSSEPHENVSKEYH